MKIKGLLQVHSTYSADSELSLREIKETAQRAGMSFVLMTEHIEKFTDDDQKNEFVSECSRLSSGSFILVPGFERKEGGYHYLYFNDQMKVLAHTNHYKKLPPLEELRQLDGVEVWNAKYDSRFALDVNVWRYLSDNNILLTAGVDAHNKHQLTKLWLEVEADDLSASDILNAIKKRRFVVNNGRRKIDLNNFNFSNRREILALRFGHLVSLIRNPLRTVARTILVPKSLRMLFHRFF